MASGRRRSGGLGRRDRKVVLFDPMGDERTTSRDALTAAGIPPETKTLSTSQLEELEAVEPEAARARALRLVGYRERSRSEVRSRLIEDGYPLHLAEEVTDRLVELALIDDARFAEGFARSKVASGWGRSRIYRALREHSLPDDIVVSTLDQVLPEDEEADRALQVLRNAPLSTRKDRERALRRLVSKGFTFSQAKDAVERARRDSDKPV